MLKTQLDAEVTSQNDWTGFSIGRAWIGRARLTPDAVALVYEEQQWCYRELHCASVRAAIVLRQRGLTAGDRVVLMMDNGPDFLVAFFSCQLLGVVAVPASPKSSPERVQYMLDDSTARLVLIEPGISTRTRAVHEAQPYHGNILELTLDVTSAGVADGDFAGDEDVSPDACAFIQYTSGSTGHSKGVMISHRAALENVRSFCAGMALTRGDVFSSLLPLFHDMGLMCFGLAPMLYGYTLILYPQESISLYRWLSGIAEHKVKITGAPDSLLQIANRVVQDPSQYDLQGLRMLICGSEPIRRESVESFGSRFGVLQAIKPAYGMAELTLCVTITPVGTPLRIDANGNVASGTPIDGVQVRIRSEDGRNTGAAFEKGEIMVRSPSVMMGYWQRPEASAETLDSEGFLQTGDLGYLDEDGFLYVIGRNKNMLVRSGQKYSPHDIEMAAHGFPELRRAAVVQLQTTSIVAVLEVDRRMLNDPATLAALAKRYRQSAFTAAGISPDACWFVSGGTIPTTENGKFRHMALRVMIETGVLQPGWTDVAVALKDGGNA